MKLFISFSFEDHRTIVNLLLDAYTIYSLNLLTKWGDRRSTDRNRGSMTREIFPVVAKCLFNLLSRSRGSQSTSNGLLSRSVSTLVEMTKFSVSLWCQETWKTATEDWIPCLLILPYTCQNYLLASRVLLQVMKRLHLLRTVLTINHRWYRYITITYFISVDTYLFIHLFNDSIDL